MQKQGRISPIFLKIMTRGMEADGPGEHKGEGSRGSVSVIKIRVGVPVGQVGAWQGDMSVWGLEGERDTMWWLQFFSLKREVRSAAGCEGTGAGRGGRRGRRCEILVSESGSVTEKHGELLTVTV